MLFLWRAMMRVEHLIQVNDHALTQAVLNRATVAAGLHLRAIFPQWANDQITDCQWLQTFEPRTQVGRIIHMGSAFSFEEQICLTPNHALVVDVLPNTDQAGGSLSITIEEPETDHLFLRFIYEIPLDEQTVDQGVNVASYIEQAYRDLDLAFVKQLREVAGTVWFIAFMKDPQRPMDWEHMQCQFISN
jgi:hypothetical protein